MGGMGDPQGGMDGAESPGTAAGGVGRGALCQAPAGGLAAGQAIKALGSSS